MIGTAIGPYQVIAKLGEGGMGEVYRARDPRLARDVALKILRDRAGGQASRIDRFVTEARAASALNHPNIIAVFDAAVDGSTPYLVTELIDGESLATEIRRAPMPLKRVLDLATQIADGLAEAHAFGIVHGDLKPENIMVTRAGRVKIVDFGLAHSARPAAVVEDVSAYDATATITVPGLRGGTVPYMSPELARGEATDFRSDQFSFGLVLYEMVTGRPAFTRGTPAETLHAICNHEVAPLTAHQPPVPLMLCWIVERCLAKQPADRYAVTADLHRDLRMLRDRLADAIAREAPAAAAVTPEHQRIRRLGMAAAMIAFAGVVAALVWTLTRPQPVDSASLRFQPFATESTYEGYPAWSPNGTMLAYMAQVDGMNQVFTRRLTSQGASQVTREFYGANYPFWSQDEKLYFITRTGDRDGLWVVDASGGQPKMVLPDVTRAAISRHDTIAFFRDEQRAGLVDTAAVFLADADGSNVRRYDRGVFKNLWFSAGALQFSPDGNFLALWAVASPVATASLEALAAASPEIDRGWQFWLLPMPDGEPIRKLRELSDLALPSLTSLSWFPDNRHVVLDVASTKNPGAHLWIADVVGDRAWQLTTTPGSEYAPSVSPDGKKIAFSSGHPQYDLYEIPIENSEAPRVLLDTARNETDGVWAPDGRSYTFVTDRNGQEEILNRMIDPQDRETSLVNAARDFTDGRTFMLTSPAYDRTGRRLAYQRHSASVDYRIWNTLLPGGSHRPVVAPTREGLQAWPTFHPNGEWIAFVEWAGGPMRLVKARVGGSSPPETIRADGVPHVVAHWSPTGDWITWETPEGFVLVSPDNRNEQRLPMSPESQFLVHTWSADGAEIYAISLNLGNFRLAVEAIDVATKRIRTLRDLGPAVPVNAPVRGLSFNPSRGKRGTLLTSIVKVPGDILLLDGFELPVGLIDRLRKLLQNP